MIEQYDSYDYSYHNKPRARKDHRCSGCHETIRRGTRYHQYNGVMDGAWETIRQCTRCAMTYAFLLELAPQDNLVCLHLNCGTYLNADVPAEIEALAYVLPNDSWDEELLDRAIASAWREVELGNSLSNDWQ